MYEITSIMVKKLRLSTNAGIMECKNALKNTNGDLKKAAIYLRTKGIIKASTKQNRIKKNGIIHIESNTNKEYIESVMLEMNCETDFAAKNNIFSKLAQDISHHIINKFNNYDKFTEGKLIENEQYLNSTNITISEKIKETVAIIGEGINLKGFIKLKGNIIGTYLHNNNQIGALISITINEEFKKSLNKVQTFANDLAMHITALAPPFIDISHIPNDFIEQEKKIINDQMLKILKNKPNNIIDKILSDKLNKNLSEICFLNQPFVKNPKISINEFIKNIEKSLSINIKVNAYYRFQVGN